MNEKLARLSRLIGSDEGFYVLALHSFVEWYLRSVKQYGDEPKFGDLTWRLREELLADRGDTVIQGLSCLARLGHQHFFTNQVRHAFELLDAEEASCATHLFVSFCVLVGLGDNPEVRILAESLSVWNERTSVLSQRAVLSRLQSELALLQTRNRELLMQKTAYDAAQEELRDLRLQIGRFDLDLERERRRAEQKDDRVDELRHERAALVQERNRLEQKLAGFDDLRRYLRYLARFSIYTRTRMDYERSISQLTPEQEDAVGAISLKKDFLVKGGAGTGKSMVLVEALRRAIRQQELEFESGEHVAFVTYTKTLAKYNQYLSDLVGMNLPVKLIRTVDSLVFRLLKRVDPDYGFDYEAVNAFVQTLSGETDESGVAAGGAPSAATDDVESTETPPVAGLLMPSLLSAEELASEIENYLFANDLDRKEYVDDLVVRRGMPHRLARQDRETIWAIRNRVAAWMDGRKLFSRNYSRIKILRFIAATGPAGSNALKDIAYLFLDEVQDLTAVDLRLIRAVTRRSIIMAGDTDQSLYTNQMPFQRAGISITGTTKILKTNFRNTCQIHRVAEAFRRRAPTGTWDTGIEPFAFREGPIPELYLADTEEELLTLLCRKADIFVRELGYEPENIAVLVPRNIELDHASGALAALGLPSSVVTASDFTFSDRDRIRLCTFHSSKGLDFPVVLLYLPYLHRRDQFDVEGTERLARNLVYVGMTRAMDNLNVFLKPGDDPVLRDLAESFGSTAPGDDKEVSFSTAVAHQALDASQSS